MRLQALVGAGVPPEPADFGAVAANLDEAVRELEAIGMARPFRVLAGGRDRGERRRRGDDRRPRVQARGRLRAGPARPPLLYEQGRLLPLRLVGYDPAYPWPEGRVEAELVPAADNPRTQRRRLSGRAWVAWAGEPVEDGVDDLHR